MEKWTQIKTGIQPGASNLESQYGTGKFEPSSMLCHRLRQRFRGLISPGSPQRSAARKYRMSRRVPERDSFGRFADFMKSKRRNSRAVQPRSACLQEKICNVMIQIFLDIWVASHHVGEVTLARGEMKTSKRYVRYHNLEKVASNFKFDFNSLLWRLRAKAHAQPNICMYHLE